MLVRPLLCGKDTVAAYSVQSPQFAPPRPRFAATLPQSAPGACAAAEGLKAKDRRGSLPSGGSCALGHKFYRRFGLTCARPFVLSQKRLEGADPSGNIFPS